MIINILDFSSWMYSFYTIILFKSTNIDLLSKIVNFNTFIATNFKVLE